MSGLEASEAAGLFDRIRDASAAVMERARSVRIDDAALARLVGELDGGIEPPDLDPAHHFVGEPDETLAFILTLDAINFGSGYFPHLRKRSGLSGYFTVAFSLKEHWEAHGAWDAAALQALSAEELAEIIGQDLAVPEAAELMGLFARALGDLGRFLTDEFRGDPAGLIEAAGGSAERLAGMLACMPFYRDVSHYDGFDVPFYKRAQLTSADLATAFEHRGYGAFSDLDQLTIFADNLVPHVLRRRGVLEYTPELAAKIDAEEPLVAGSREEVEIRAGAVHAVERCVEHLRGAGVDATAQQLDYLLWTRGQDPAIKAHPRHRACTTWY